MLLPVCRFLSLFTHQHLPPPRHTPTGTNAITTTCRPPAGSTSLPPTFDVTFSVEDGATDCKVTGSRTLTVTTECCVTSGTAFVYGQGGFSGATCFTSLPSGTCIQSKWGWVNKLSAAGSNTYNIITGGGDNCKNVADPARRVGQLNVVCSQATVSKKTSATFTMSIAPGSRFVVTGALDQHYFLGCSSSGFPSVMDCSPPTFGAPKNSTCSAALNVGVCGGDAADLLGKPITLPCACSSIYYVYHESVLGDTAWRVPRNADLTCPKI